MAGGKIQLDATGRRRLRPDGKRILADDAVPCCCAPACPCPTCPDEELPATLTLDLELLESTGPDVWEPHTITLSRDAACEYSGAVNDPGGTWDGLMFYLERESLLPAVDCYTWKLPNDIPDAGENPVPYQVTPNSCDPTGAYTDMQIGAYADFVRNVVIS